MKRRNHGKIRTNWRRGLMVVPDTGPYGTLQVGAIIGSHQDSCEISAGYNMLQVATHWAGFECSIKMLYFEDAQTAALNSHRWYHVTYSISTSAYVGIHGHQLCDGFATAFGVDPSIVFNWQAVIVSI